MVLPGTTVLRVHFFCRMVSALYFAAGKLKKFAVSGGAAVTVYDNTPAARGGVWGHDDTHRVSAQHTGVDARVVGGLKLEPLTSLADGESTHRVARTAARRQGRGFLYRETGAAPPDNDDANIVVQPLTLRRAPREHRTAITRVIDRVADLVYVHDGARLPRCRST